MSIHSRSRLECIPISARFHSRRRLAFYIVLLRLDMGREMVYMHIIVLASNHSAFEHTPLSDGEHTPVHTQLSCLDGEGYGVWRKSLG